MSYDINQPGGSAFPIIPPLDTDGGSASGYPFPTSGMSLRDYFAAHVLGSIVALNWNDDTSTLQIASFSYACADAMLEAREKPRADR